MASIVAHCKAVGDFVKQITSTKAYPEVMKAQKVHLEQMLATTSLSMQDASDVSKAMQGIPWPEDSSYLQDLLLITASKTLESGMCSSVVRCKLQNYTALAHYFTSQQWNLLSDSRSGSNHKLELFVQHALKLGLRNASEASLQTLTGLLLISSEGLSGAASLSPSTKYQTLQHIKKVVKKSWSLPSSAWVLVLPDTPAEFKEKFKSLYDDAFPSDPPVACPFDLVHVAAVCSSIPMRSSSKLLGPCPIPTSSTTSPQMPSPFEMMQQMFKFMQSSSQQSAASGLNLQILGGASSSGGQGSGQRALMGSEPTQIPSNGFHLEVHAPGPKEEDLAEEVVDEDSPTPAPRVTFVAEPTPVPAAGTQHQGKGQKAKPKLSVKESTDLILSQITKKEAERKAEKDAEKARAKAEKDKEQAQAKQDAASSGLDKNKGKGKKKGEGKGKAKSKGKSKDQKRIIYAPPLERYETNHARTARCIL